MELMPYTEDLEGGRDHGSVDDHREQPQSTSNQPILDSLQQLERESTSDNSQPLFSMYCKIAEEEDNKMVKRFQNDSVGILIFTGLFSATVAALLTVSIPDLKSNSQDTSAFYLRNIYQVVGNPDVSPSIPSALAEPPAFSPPRYAIWVNSLWFLSLAVSLSCATETLILRNWAVQYISVTQPPNSTSEKQARIRAIFAKGNPGPNVIWGTSRGPILLHLSLFLFIAGGLIYLFNINLSVFYAVVWWVGYMAISYTGATVAVFFDAHNLLNTPLSPLALRIYLAISYAVLQVFAFCSFLPPLHGLLHNMRRHHRDLNNRYKKGFLNGKRRAVKEIALKPSSEIDSLILERIFTTLDDDHAQETFFKAIPGFCHSKSSDLPLSSFLQKLGQSFDEFLDRTFSSKLIPESVRTRRLIICLNAAHAALGPSAVSEILDNVFNGRWDEALKSVEIGLALRLWGREHDLNVRRIVACIMVRVRERDDRWIKLVKEAFGVPDHVLRDSLPHGNSVLLSILIHISRELNRAGSWTCGILRPLSKFDICNTLPELQHEFCAMWNENALDARNRGPYSIPTQILREIRHLYVALHQDTDAAPTAFSASTDSSDHILTQPLSYPLCSVPSHANHDSHSIPSYVQLIGARRTEPTRAPTILPLADEETIPRPLSPSEPTSLSEIGDSSHASATSPALSVHTSARPTDESSAVALTDALPPATLSYPLEGTTQQDIGAPSAEPDIGVGEISSTSDVKQSPIRVRGLVNAGSMCFVNTVLQLLVHSPPFWNLFGELGNLKGQRGAGGAETGGGATPLVDATVRFFEEFMIKEEPPPTQQPTQQAVSGKPREGEEAKTEHIAVGSFEPTYMYNSIKEKRRLKHLLDGQHQDAEEFFRLYLDALDEELVALFASIGSIKSTGVVEEREVTQSGLTDVAESVDSPLMRICGGKFRSILRAPNQPDFVTIEDWRSLQLDIQHDSVNTIEDALARISHVQPVELDPSGFSSASRQVLIEALPPVLVLHLKRFLYDVTADSIVKISKPVKFTPELEISPEILVPFAKQSAEPVHYKLYGVLYHQGGSPGSGHYTVDVLHQNGDGGSGEAWLHIDDEVVSAVSHEDVFGGHYKDFRTDMMSRYM